MREAREILAARLRRQAAGCSELGSPFYGSLLDASADDVVGGGPVWRVLTGFEAEPGGSALALRLMGAVHRLVLEDTLPELARHYPSTGGDGDAAAAWPVFREAVDGHRARIHELVRGGCQTNEVGRCTSLLGGFLEVAHRSRLSLRILEIGASAGLNLRWDRYRYESPSGSWGDPDSPVRFENSFAVAPPLNRAADVVERKGCDLNPIDPASEEGALALRSFVWADQLHRLSLLDGAIEVARAATVEVERLDAADFLERELAEPARGVATVVFHSVFMQYIAGDTRDRIMSAIRSAARRFGADAPVHHLAMEPGQLTFEVRLDGELVATTRPHGTGVRWLVR